MSAVSWVFSGAVRRLLTFRGSERLGLSVAAAARPGWAPALSPVDGNPFPGCTLPALGAPRLPSSAGPSPPGHGRFGGRPGTAPRGAGEAVAALSRLSQRAPSLGGAPPPGGLRRGAPGGACGLGPSRGGRSLRAEGRASLARPQLGRGGRGLTPGLGRGPRHRDGGGVVRAAGGVHVGRAVHGQHGRRGRLPSWTEREREEAVRPGPRPQSPACVSWAATMAVGAPAPGWAPHLTLSWERAPRGPRANSGGDACDLDAQDRRGQRPALTRTGPPSHSSRVPESGVSQAFPQTPRAPKVGPPAADPPNHNLVNTPPRHPLPPPGSPRPPSPWCHPSRRLHAVPQSPQIRGPRTSAPHSSSLRARVPPQRQADPPAHPFASWTPTPQSSLSCVLSPSPRPGN